MVHVGGGSERLGIASGIHWHMNVANEIEYVDHRRQAADHSLRAAEGLAGQRARVPRRRRHRRSAGKGERRRMDCMDCHNRPGHPFSATPERAVDGALARGEISRDATVRATRDGRAC